jgi:hypothetical protein
MTTPTALTPAQIEEQRHPTAHDFEIWMMNLDFLIEENFGLTSEDMPDQLYRDWFGEDLTPEEAYQRALENFQAEYPPLSTYTQEFDEFTDADPGL